MSCTGKKLHRRCLSHCDFTHLSDISFTTHRIMSFDHCCNVITLCILSKSYSYLFPFLLLVLRCVSLPPGRLYVVDARTLLCLFVGHRETALVPHPTLTELSFLDPSLLRCVTFTID